MGFDWCCRCPECQFVCENEPPEKLIYEWNSGAEWECLRETDPVWGHEPCLCLVLDPDRNEPCLWTHDGMVDSVRLRLSHEGKGADYKLGVCEDHRRDISNECEWSRYFEHSQVGIFDCQNLSIMLEDGGAGCVRVPDQTCDCRSHACDWVCTHEDGEYFWSLWADYCDGGCECPGEPDYACTADTYGVLAGVACGTTTTTTAAP